MWNQTSRKFIAGFVGIIAASLFLLYVTQMYFSPERQAERRLAELERQYAEDTYGGKTPEETLQLFIDALKAGDIELASKYFLPGGRESIKNDLEQIQREQNMNQVVDLVKNLKLSEIDNRSAFFMTVDENDVVQMQATLQKNGNGVWKIIEI